MLSEAVRTLWCAVAMVVACHMVRNKVHDHFHASLVCAFDKCLELLATLLDVHCKVRVIVIIVLYGVWRTGLSLYYGRVVGWYTIFAVVATCSVLNDTSVPHMGSSGVAYRTQGSRCDVVEFSTAILFYCSAGNAIGIAVTKKSRQ